jgi:hypothetical protein
VSLTPAISLQPVWPPPLSLATTRRISVDFSSSPYLDVSVQAVPRICLCVQHMLRTYCVRGFPHSEICGSRDICSSPQLIAACHVLLRLPVPRHSPCALSSLTFELYGQIFSSIVDSHFVFPHCVRKFLSDLPKPSKMLSKNRQILPASIQIDAGFIEDGFVLLFRSICLITVVIRFSRCSSRSRQMPISQHPQRADFSVQCPRFSLWALKSILCFSSFPYSSADRHSNTCSPYSSTAS